jgi:hypothetical protein
VTITTIDPILQRLSVGAAQAGLAGGSLVRLVADGVVWQGRIVGPAAWADAVTSTPAEGDLLGELDAAAEASGYLHLATASFLAGDEWHRAHGVRIAIDSVSAWWRHSDEN